MKSIIKILFIEDDPDDIASFKKVLELGECEGYDFDFATTSEEALSQMEIQKYQVVVTDFRLGAETALSLVEILMSKEDPPIIIVMTGQGDTEVAVNLLKMGVSDYLIKDDLGMHLKMLSKVIGKSINEKHLKLQKQQALDALRESQKRYHRLETNLPDNFIYAHGVDGVFTYISCPA